MYSEIWKIYILTKITQRALFVRHGSSVALAVLLKGYVISCTHFKEVASEVHYLLVLCSTGCLAPLIVLLFIQVRCWLVILGIYVPLAVFQPYGDLEEADNQSLKFKWWGGESNPGPLAPKAKSLTTRPPQLPCIG